MNIRVNAYAKINLHLDVTKIRDDGYHNIQSIMQSISLCDIVDIEIINEEKIIIECNTADVPLDEKNIAYKAAKRFFEKANIKSGAVIKIQKNIPMAAGLAGGSADGAAVLVGLNKLFENALSQNELYALGASLGADIPFCMTCGCCYIAGIGDELTEVEPLSTDTVLVIACGGEGVSTPMAYRLLDDKYNKFINYEPRGYMPLISKIADRSNDFCDLLFNIFEEPISNERPAVGNAKAIMLECGARAAMMSGSGPSVFGVFLDASDANRAVESLKKQGYFASAAFPTGKQSV